MKRFGYWAIRLLGVYFALLMLVLAFSFGAMRFSGLASLERKLSPSTFVFWQGGEYYSNPPLFTKVMNDSEGQFSSREPESIEDVDTWVLLLEGFEDIRNFDLAPHLGIDVSDVAATSPGTERFNLGASLQVRLHPIPFFIARRHVVMLDAKYLRKNYKPQCLDEIVYGAMIGVRDQELWDRCEVV